MTRSKARRSENDTAQSPNVGNRVSTLLTPAVLITLVGLITTTAISMGGLYFTAHSRKARLREVLFERQLALSIRVMRVLGKLKTFAPMVMDRAGPFYEQAREDLGVTASRLAETADIASAILPTDLYVEVQQLSRLVISFLVDHDEGRNTDEFPPRLAGHASKTALLARTYLGIDELSDESSRLYSGKKKLANVRELDSAALAAQFTKDDGR
jgi:hypothetical protein